MNYHRIPLGPLWTNSFTFWDDQKRAFIVDPGGDPGDVITFLTEQGLDLQAIMLTHGHADHLLGVAALKALTGAEVIMPEGDAAMAQDPVCSLANDLRVDQRPFKPDRLVRDGDRFVIGSFQVETLHTPGHTPGSSCYMVTSGDDRVLVVGDTLFARSIGRTDLPGGDDRAMEQSLARLKALEGDLPVLPGHGPETGLQEERLHNPFLR